MCSERYANSLDARLEKMEGLLQRVSYYDFHSSHTLKYLYLHQIDTDEAFHRKPGDNPPRTTTRLSSPDNSRVLPPAVQATPPRLVDHRSVSSPATSEETLDVSDEEIGGIQEQLRALCMPPLKDRFFGKSSNVALIHTAINAKPRLSGGTPVSRSRRPEFWDICSVSMIFICTLHSETKVTEVGTPGLRT